MIKRLLCVLVIILLGLCLTSCGKVKSDDTGKTYHENHYTRVDISPDFYVRDHFNAEEYGVVEIDFSPAIFFPACYYYGDVLDNPEIIFTTFGVVYIRDDINYLDLEFNVVKSLDSDKEDNVYGKYTLNDILGEKTEKYKADMYDYKYGFLYIKGNFHIDYYGDYLVLWMDGAYYIRVNGDIYRVKSDFISVVEACAYKW